MSKELTDSEVNQIIADFMGWKLYEDKCEGETMSGGYWIELPTQSLDALVPVWEKLNCTPDFSLDWNENQHKEMYWCELSDKYGMETPYGYSCADTIHQAAAHATAQAILNLRGNK